MSDINPPMEQHLCVNVQLYVSESVCARVRVCAYVRVCV